MMITKHKNIIIDGSAGKPIGIDLVYKADAKPKQVLIFSHGFKGFKDWGPFNDIAHYFAEQDIVFVKFNFSFNGTTTDDPLNFGDLKAFGNNNFCKELNDLKLVIDWIYETSFLANEIDLKNISLFGHSRGGGISILKAAEDTRITKVISWASPSNFLNRLPKGEKLEKWRETNVAYIYNGRTKQNMPMYFQFYKNCKANNERLSIEKAIRSSRVPHLIVHGSEDPTVLIDEAESIKNWGTIIDLHIIKGANHVLGGFHPYNLKQFPKDLKEAITVSIEFLKR